MLLLFNFDLSCEVAALLRLTLETVCDSADFCSLLGLVTCEIKVVTSLSCGLVSVVDFCNGLSTGEIEVVTSLSCSLVPLLDLCN